MRPIWVLATVFGLTAGPAFAQGLLPPSRQYATPQREKLDKTYGLPTFGTQGDAMPKQRATVQPQQERPATPFTGLSTFAKPDDKPADTPDFFQRPTGLATSETGVPNFFDNPQDTVRPKIGTAAPKGETPAFTTDEGLTTGGDTTSVKPPANDAQND
jgi:hypothetical protein